MRSLILFECHSAKRCRPFGLQPAEFMAGGGGHEKWSRKYVAEEMPSIESLYAAFLFLPPSLPPPSPLPLNHTWRFPLHSKHSSFLFDQTVSSEEHRKIIYVYRSETTNPAGRDLLERSPPGIFNLLHC